MRIDLFLFSTFAASNVLQPTLPLMNVVAKQFRQFCEIYSILQICMLSLKSCTTWLIEQNSFFSFVELTRKLVKFKQFFFYFCFIFIRRKQNICKHFLFFIFIFQIKNSLFYIFRKLEKAGKVKKFEAWNFFSKMPEGEK